MIATDRDAKSGKADEGKKAKIRIEIVVSPDVKAEEFKDWLKKLHGVASEMQGSVIILRQGVALWQKPAGGGAYVPAPVAGPRPESRPLILGSTPAGSLLSISPDKRINDLERKLEKVLHELQDMRKEMKRSRPDVPPGDTSTPPLPATTPTPPSGTPVPVTVTPAGR